jgi:Tfp pilus assembly PilM family ATPase
VDRRVRLLRSAGLYPVRLGVPSLAVAELFHRSDDGPADGETLAIMNLAGRDADIVILSRHFVFPRAVHREDGDWQDAAAELAGHVSDAIRYCRFGLQQGEVHRAWLTGCLRGAGPALAAAISSMTNLEVAVWDPAERLGLRVRPGWRDAAALDRDPTCLTACLGLALPPGRS